MHKDRKISTGYTQKKEIAEHGQGAINTPEGDIIPIDGEGRLMNAYDIRFVPFRKSGEQADRNVLSLFEDATLEEELELQKPKSPKISRPDPDPDFEPPGNLPGFNWSAFDEYF